MSDDDGFIVMDEYQRSIEDDNIFAVGIASRIPAQSSGLLPLGRFTPGTVSAELGRMAGRNIAADLGFGEHQAVTEDTLKGFYVLDAQGQGLLLSLGPKLVEHAITYFRSLV